MRGCGLALVLQRAALPTCWPPRDFVCFSGLEFRGGSGLKRRWEDLGGPFESKNLGMCSLDPRQEGVLGVRFRVRVGTTPIYQMLWGRMARCQHVAFVNNPAETCIQQLTTSSRCSLARIVGSSTTTSFPTTR